MRNASEMARNILEAATEYQLFDLETPYLAFWQDTLAIPCAGLLISLLLRIWALNTFFMIMLPSSSGVDIQI